MLFYDSLDILAEFLELFSLAIETRVQCKCCEFIDASNYILHLSMYFLCARLEIYLFAIIRLVTTVIILLPFIYVNNYIIIQDKYLLTFRQLAIVKISNQHFAFSMYSPIRFDFNEMAFNE